MKLVLVLSCRTCGEAGTVSWSDRLTVEQMSNKMREWHAGRSPECPRFESGVRETRKAEGGRKKGQK